MPASCCLLCRTIIVYLLGETMYRCHETHTCYKNILASFGAWKLLLCSVVWLFSAAASGQSDPDERAAIEIISIDNRDPSSIRATLYPLLDPRGSIGQIDNKLVIATTASNLAQLRALILDTDIPRRRLVISVDFFHGSGELSDTRQERVQAIEGDEIRIVDPSLAENPDAPALLVLAEIRDESVNVSFQLEHVGGFTGRYTMRLPLGVWYVINPEDDGVDEPEGTDIFDLGNVLTDGSATTADAAGLAPAPVPPIALRVDVLP
jgi:hypothetical protein